MVKPSLHVEVQSPTWVKLTFKFEHELLGASDAQDIVRWQRDGLEDTETLGAKWADALTEQQKDLAEYAGQSQGYIDELWNDPDPPKFVQFSANMGKFTVICEIRIEFNGITTPDLVRFANRALASDVVSS